MKFFLIWFQSQFHEDEYYAKATSAMNCEMKFRQWYDNGQEREYGELQSFSCTEVTPGEYYFREKTNPSAILF